VRSIPEIHALIEQLETEKNQAASNLEFEKAAELRDKLKRLKEKEIAILQ
jgi:excinuclease ABC subunit B